MDTTINCQHSEQCFSGRQMDFTLAESGTIPVLLFHWGLLWFEIQHFKTRAMAGWLQLSACPDVFTFGAVTPNTARTFG